MIQATQEFSKDGKVIFKMTFRGGYEDKIVSEPKADVSIYSYTTFEIYCHAYLPYLNSYSLFADPISDIDKQFPKQQDFVYQISKFDSTLIAIASWEAINNIRIILDRCGYTYSTLIDAKSSKQIKSNNYIFQCRACNEFNPFGEADGIADDNKYTCYSCTRSLTRRQIGLTIDQLFELLKQNKLI
jgi:hypothetical protein